MSETAQNRAQERYPGAMLNFNSDLRDPESGVTKVTVLSRKSGKCQIPPCFSEGLRYSEKVINVFSRRDEGSSHSEFLTRIIYYSRNH